MAIITEKLDPNKTGAIYGTLDVSSCSTTKTSRFNPNETIAVTTAPVGTTIASQATDNTSPAVTTPQATLATNSNGNYVGSIPATTVTDMPMYMARLIRQARTVQTTAPTAILTAVTDTTAANRQKIIRRSMMTRIIRIYNSYM